MGGNYTTETNQTRTFTRMDRTYVQYKARPSISISSTTVRESDGVAKLTMSIDDLPADSTDSYQVSWSTKPGTATEEKDFTASSGTVTLSAEHKSKEIEIPITKDDRKEGNKSFSVAISASGDVIVAQGTGEVRLEEDPPQVEVLRVVGGDVREDAGQITLKFIRKLPEGAGQAIRVTYELSGDAVADDDYVSPNPLYVDFAADESEKEVAVDLIDDDLAERAEYVDVRITHVELLDTTSSSEGGNENEAELEFVAQTGQVRILDDDQVKLDLDVPQKVGEGEEFLTVTATLQQAALQDCSFRWEVRSGGGSAAAGADDVQLTSGTVLFREGETSKSFQVRIKNDRKLEPDETFEIVFSEPQALDIQGETTRTVTIEDDDVEVSIEDGSGAEASGAAEVVVTAVGLKDGQSRTIRWQASGKTAAEGDDFAADQSGTITLTSAGASQTISITLLDDDEVEGSEKLTIGIAADSDGDVVLKRKQAEVTIVDDDEPPKVEISDAQADEAGGSVAVAVQLSAPAPSGASVRWRTVAGSAGTSDFTSAEGTITFAKGDTGAQIFISIVDDANSEPDETFSIELYSPTNVEIDGATAVVTILDDDSDSDSDDDLDEPRKGDEPGPCKQCDCAAMCARDSRDDVDPRSRALTTDVRTGGLGGRNATLSHQDSLVEAGQIGLDVPVSGAGSSGGGSSGGGSDATGSGGNSGGATNDARTAQIEVHAVWDDPAVQAALGGFGGTFDIASGSDAIQRLLLAPSTPPDASADVAPGIYGYTATVVQRNAQGQVVSSVDYSSRSVVVSNRLPGLAGGWTIKEVDRVIATAIDPNQPLLRELIFAGGNGARIIYRAFVGQSAVVLPAPGAYRVSGRPELLFDLSSTSIPTSEPLGVAPPAEARYALVRGGGAVDYFDSAGFVIAKADRNGNATRFEYDAADHRLLKITDPAGRAQTFEYADGRLAAMRDHLGRAVELVYDGDRVAEVRDVARMTASGPASPAYAFEYDASGSIAARIDPTGRRSTFSRDSAGRVNTVERVDGQGSAVGDPVRYGSSAGGPTSTIVAGRYQTVITDSTGTKTLETDRSGFLLKEADVAGNVTEYERDRAGRVVAVKENGVVIERRGYDADGRLAVLVHADATFETWTYDDRYDAITQHVDRTGRTTNYALDARGNVVSSVRIGDAATGDVVTNYVFTPPPIVVGDLPGGLLSTVSVVLADGRIAVTEYVYGTSVPSPTNPTADDDRGRVVRTDSYFLVAGAVVDRTSIRYFYDARGQVRRVEMPDPDGDAGPQLPDVTLYEYDEAGRRTAVTQLGYAGPTNSAGSQGGAAQGGTSQTSGGSQSGGGSQGGGGFNEDGPAGSGNSSAGRTTRFRYDAAGNLVETIDPLGRRTLQTYDAAGRVTVERLVRGTLDADADPTNPAPAVDGDLLDVVTFFTYDLRGNRLSERSTAAPEFRYEYDSLDRLTRSTQVVGEFDGGPGGDDLSFRYVRDSRGRVVDFIDPSGIVTHTDYDLLDRPVRVRYASGTSDQAETRYVYEANGDYGVIDPLGRRTDYQLDALGRLKSVTAPDPDGAAGPQSAPVTTFAYDRLGRLVGTVDPLGRTTGYAYDRAGRVTRTTLPDPDGPGSTSTTSTAAAQDAPEYQSRYDAAGRRIETIDPLGRSTLYAYDRFGRLTSETDALGNRTEYAYDAADRLIEVRTPSPLSGEGGGEGSSHLASVTRYVYDDLDRRTSVTLAAGTSAAATTSYAYDAWSRVIETVDPTGRRTAYAYDAAGRPASTTRVAGAVDRSTYYETFDENGQVTGSGYAETDDATTRYAYDRAGNLTAVTDATGRTSYFAYDAAGRRTGATDPTGAVTRTFYDAAGRMTGLLDAAGRTLEYAYDRLDRRTSETDALGNRTEYAYDAAGRLLTVRHPLPSGEGGGEGSSGLTSPTSDLRPLTSYEYDALDRRTAVTSAPGTASAQRTEFAYDAAGNRTLLRDAAGNETRWTYDALDRVTVETIDLEAGPGILRASQRAWTYNGAGLVAAYVARNERVTTYAYDALGRRVQEDWFGSLAPAGGEGVSSRTFAYRYDAAGRLIEVDDAGGPDFGYSYDALGRLSTTVQTGLTSQTLVQTQTYDQAGRRTQAVVGRYDSTRAIAPCCVVWHHWAIAS